MNSILVEFLSQIEDGLSEQASLDSSVYGGDDLLRKYQNYYNDIYDSIEEYSNVINFNKELNLPDNIKDVTVEDPVEDIARSVEIIVEEYLIKEELKKIKDGLLNHIDDLSLIIMSRLNSMNINYTDFIKNNIESINSIDNFNEMLVKNIIEYNNQNIEKLFTSSDLNKNKIYKHYSKLLNFEISEDFNTFKSIFYSKFNFMTNNRNTVNRILSKINNYSNIYENSILMYRKYIHLYKNYNNLNKDNPNHFEITDKKSVEEIDDHFYKIIEISEVRKYAKSVLGSYMHLMDEDGFKRFEYLKNSKISKNKVKDAVSNIAIFEYSKILNLALNDVINNDKTNAKDILKMITENNLDAEVLINDEYSNILAIKINNFEASAYLGSRNWCISKNKSHYINYLSKTEERNHVFVYDFNKKETDSTYMFAFTINENGLISSAFNYRNSNILSNLLSDNIIKNDILNNIVSSYVYALKEDKLINELKGKTILFKELYDKTFEVLSFIAKNINYLDKIKYNKLDIIEISNKELDRKNTKLTNSEKIDLILTLSKKIKFNPFENKKFQESFNNESELFKNIMESKYSDSFKLNLVIRNKNKI